MSTTAMTLGARPRPRPSGPALRRFRLPFGPLALSACAHAGLAAALLVGALLWPSSPTKTYIVNLVPAVATVGAPQGRPAPDLPPRVAPAPPRSTEPVAARELPPPAPALPDRGPSASSAALPDRPQPSRVAAPALPSPGDKELPNVASVPTPKPPPAAAPAATATAPPPPPPPPPAPSRGSAGGSPQGAGAVTLNVADFPYAWYIQAIQRKIQERWEGKAISGRQPLIIFEIGRDGRLLGRPKVDKPSGNRAYDELAIRAVNEATPFPQLPEGFQEPMLRLHLQFIYDPGAR